MHHNLNILEMKQVLEMQPFIPNANRLNIWQLNNLKLQFIFKIWSYRIVFDVIKNVRKLFDDRMFNNLVIINLTFYSCVYLC